MQHQDNRQHEGLVDRVKDTLNIGQYNTQEPGQQYNTSTGAAFDSPGGISDPAYGTQSGTTGYGTGSGYGTTGYGDNRGTYDNTTDGVYGANRGYDNTSGQQQQGGGPVAKVGHAVERGAEMVGRGAEKTANIAGRAAEKTADMAGHAAGRGAEMTDNAMHMGKHGNTQKGTGEQTGYTGTEYDTNKGYGTTGYGTTAYDTTTGYTDATGAQTGTYYTGAAGATSVSSTSSSSSDVSRDAGLTSTQPGALRQGEFHETGHPDKQAILNAYGANVTTDTAGQSPTVIAADAPRAHGASIIPSTLPVSLDGVHPTGTAVTPPTRDEVLGGGVMKQNRGYEQEAGSQYGAGYNNVGTDEEGKQKQGFIAKVKEVVTSHMPGHNKK